MDVTREFPGLRRDGTTYLNSCAHGLLPRRTRAAIERHMARWEGAPDWTAWDATIDDARREFARLIGAREGEVAVHANASAAIQSVVSSLQPGPRRTLVTTDVDFPAAPFVAQRHARARGFRHEHVPALPGTLSLDAFGRHVSRDTALACIPYVASFTGQRLDARAFAEAAHAQGAPLLVDAFQGCGTFPIDVRRDDVDFLVSGVYKWLMAPAGLAFLYARRDHHGLVPMSSGWQGAADPYAFDPHGELAPDARRFQQGGASVIACAAAAESMRLLQEVGLANVARSNGALVDRIIDGARARKWDVLTPDERASIVTFRVPDLERALAACAKEKVVVGPRIGGVRVAPHFYNEASDVERLFDVLDGA